MDWHMTLLYLDFTRLVMPRRHRWLPTDVAAWAHPRCPRFPEPRTLPNALIGCLGIGQRLCPVPTAATGQWLNRQLLPSNDLHARPPYAIDRSLSPPVSKTS